VMSADSAVTFSSVHSEARSWSILSEDPYEEAAQQLFEQVPHPSEYMETRLQDTERRMMAALELVNRRRQAADDFAVEHIMRTQVLEARAHDDTLEDTGSSS
nr:hypothetical protein [Tanacetum cinerariifolium]